MRDLDLNLAVSCTVCGFAAGYSRPAEQFAYLVRDGGHLMLEQAGVGRNWITGPLDLPLTSQRVPP